tara:strand:+ start:169 stop:699 length:531 start_codon:yes stop_codon:yes gene_type:complete
LKNNSLDIRIVADTQEDIFADIRIFKKCSFKDLHNFLVDNFNLDKQEMSSFYYSNETWDKGEEITLMNMNLGDEKLIKFMDSILIDEVFSSSEMKFLYVNDFLNMNIFYVEILKENKSSSNDEISILHQLGEYRVKENKEILKTDNVSNENELDDIMNEFEEDDIQDFEELDENLY